LIYVLNFCSSTVSAPIIDLGDTDDDSNGSNPLPEKLTPADKEGNKREEISGNLDNSNKTSHKTRRSARKKEYYHSIY